MRGLHNGKGTAYAFTLFMEPNTPDPKQFGRWRTSQVLGVTQPELLSEFETLLRESRAVDSFIAANLRNHPPEIDRTGIPRGDPRPFPRKKVHAALLHLKLGGELADLDALAREAKVSYSLLGKWRTEPRFQKLLKGYEADFGWLVISFVVGWIEESYERGADEVFRVDRALGIVADLKDVAKWSPDFRKSIADILFTLTFVGDHQTTPPAERYVAIAVGLAIRKDLDQREEKGKAIRSFRAWSKELMTRQVSLFEKSLGEGNTVEARRHSDAIKAITAVLVSEELWPV